MTDLQKKTAEVLRPPAILKGRIATACAIVVLAFCANTPTCALGADDPLPAPAVSAPLPPPAVAAPPSPATSPAAAVPVLPAAAAPSTRSTLPQQLSPMVMFQQADVVVKSVILSLIFASLLSWTVWAAKSLEILLAVRQLKSGMLLLGGERSLAGASAALGTHRGAIADMVSSAATELKLSSDVTDRSGIKERIASRLAGYEAESVRRIRRGVVLLASVGATAPFVGLFGTVWGIMNSFIGISKTQTTNLAVVAPGIAEALLATAVGLVAAIPAVLLYNLLMRALATYRVRFQQAADEVARFVSRDLDRATSSAPHLRAARAAE